MAEKQLDNIDDVNNTEIIYPGVSDRIKAAVIDSFVIVVFMVVLTIVFSQFANVPDSFRFAGFIFIFLLYDPLFTSLFAGTIGHMIMNIQVKQSSNTEKNIRFPLAIIRYLIKFLLGWISLLTVGSDKKHLAIHDIVISSVVLYRNKN
ncbi:RDD family protein [bacterium]|nr:RDD family protein [bacterium]